MDWKIFATTFVTLFLAEMGDKTQFAALAASASSRSTFSVLLAVILALSLAGVLGVVAGRFLGEVVDPALLKYIAGPLFILLGVWLLLGR